MLRQCWKQSGKLVGTTRETKHFLAGREKHQSGHSDDDEDEEDAEGEGMLAG